MRREQRCINAANDLTVFVHSHEGQRIFISGITKGSPHLLLVIRFFRPAIEAGFFFTQPEFKFKQRRKHSLCQSFDSVHSISLLMNVWQG